MHNDEVALAPFPMFYLPVFHSQDYFSLSLSDTTKPYTGYITIYAMKKRICFIIDNADISVYTGIIDILGVNKENCFLSISPHYNISFSRGGIFLSFVH